jgi:hypothetical protein
MVEFINESRVGYHQTNQDLLGATITFSMIDEETGLIRYANLPATIELNTSTGGYTLVYQFTKKTSSKTGRFYGEFTVSNSQGVSVLPVRDVLNINIIDSFADSAACCKPYKAPNVTLTPTITVRATDTPTPTPTPTPIPTNPVTPSNTATNTLTPTQTPTNTPTPSVSSSPGTTPSNTPTPTPTQSSQNYYNYEVGNLKSCCIEDWEENVGIISSLTPLTIGDIVTIDYNGFVQCYEIINVPTPVIGPAVGVIVIDVYETCVECTSENSCVYGYGDMTAISCCDDGDALLDVVDSTSLLNVGDVIQYEGKCYEITVLFGPIGPITPGPFVLYINSPVYTDCIECENDYPCPSINDTIT